MRKSIAATTVALLFTTALSTGALAQAGGQKAAPPAPAAQQPAAQAPATRPAPTAGTPQAAAGGISGRGVASSPQDARKQHEAKLAERVTKCAGDKLKRWKGPHVVGDPDGKGGFYASNYNGGCVPRSLKDAIDSGVARLSQ